MYQSYQITIPIKQILTAGIIGWEQTEINTVGGKEGGPIGFIIQWPQ